MLTFFKITAAGIMLCLVAVQIALVAPHYFACKDAIQAEIVQTIWGDCITCRGESTDIVSAFYKLFNICIMMLILSTFFFIGLAEN